MVGVPICTEEYVVERALGAVQGGGKDCVKRCLAGMGHARQTTGRPHPHTKPLEQRTSCL